MLNLMQRLTDFFWEFMMPPWNGSVKWWFVNKVIGKSILFVVGLFRG